MKTIQEKLSRKDISKLYVLRENELADEISTQTTKCDITKLETYSIEDLESDIKYIERLLEINKEFVSFPKWSCSLYDNTDIRFSDKTYMSHESTRRQNVLIDKIKKTIELKVYESELVEVPENLKHLIKQL